MSYLDIVVLVGAQPTGSSFAQQRIVARVFNRAAKNPFFKLGITGTYQPIDGNGEVYFNGLIAGNTYDVYYKDDDQAEIKVATGTITTTVGYCYTNSSQIQDIIIRNKADGSVVISWLNSGYDGGAYQASIDGGSNWVNFPVSGNSTTIAAASVPAGTFSLLIRRSDIGCTFTPITNIRRVLEPPPACELSWENPEVTKTNETGPAASDGYVRLNADVSGATGTPMYRLLDEYNNEVVAAQTSNEFNGVAPGNYYGEVSDDNCTLLTTNVISVLAYVSTPTEQQPSITRDYINSNGNFTRWFYTYGMTLDDFQSYFPLEGGIDDIDLTFVDEVVDVEEVETANVRVTGAGDTRITDNGDRRVVTL